MSPSHFRRRALLISIETIGLLIGAAAVSILYLGYMAEQFTGTDFWTSLLPFALSVLSLMVFASFFLVTWWKFRKIVKHKGQAWIPLLSVVIALGSAKLIADDRFTFAYQRFRTLVGGKQEARRATLAHQVYAAYRRHSVGAMEKLIQRSQAYRPAIQEAARRYDIDADLLFGLAAAESSFIPRKSRDGGHGLFQITRLPKEPENAIKDHFGGKLSLADPRHNAFLAAATLKYYLNQMHDDLFLGLLAYNIGPTNGGLRFIMQQYGVTDFTTIQPYLQQLPRDYPIRVLSYALAFRIWHRQGKLLAYQKDTNAAKIQRIGIPGLS
ncbi:MAG: hypothetical protein Kow0065_18800 [Methylomicrobium sp.]